MKRLFLAMVAMVAVGCLGGGTSGDNAPKGESMSGSEHVVVELTLVEQTAENYKEMAMSSIENGDSQAFVAVMEQMTSWLNGLDAGDRAKADAAIKSWEERNRERMDANFERALTMPRMTSTEAASLRAN